MIQPKFIEGAIYDSTSHGLVRFDGIDVYFGQSALMFYSIDYNTKCYWLPQSLNQHFKDYK